MQFSSLFVAGLPAMAISIHIMKGSLLQKRLSEKSRRLYKNGRVCYNIIRYGNRVVLRDQMIINQEEMIYRVKVLERSLIKFIDALYKFVLEHGKNTSLLV